MHLEQENHTPHQDQIDQEVQDYVWDHSYFMKRPPAQCRNILLDPITFILKRNMTKIIFFMHLEQENHTPHQDQINQEVQDYV